MVTIETSHWLPSIPHTEDPGRSLTIESPFGEIDCYLSEHCEFVFTSSGRIRTGDFNGDGLTDLLWYGKISTVEGWYVSLSTGSAFSPSQLILAQPSPPPSDSTFGNGPVNKKINMGAGATIGDFDGDGRDDVLVAAAIINTVISWPTYLPVYSSYSLPESQWILLTSNSIGSSAVFSSQNIPNAVYTGTHSNWYNMPATLEPCDLDNDGRTDLMVTMTTFGLTRWQLSVNGGDTYMYCFPLRNMGGGNFVNTDEGISHKMPLALQDANGVGDPAGFHKMMGDVNGDGLPDIVYLKMDYDYVNIHLNHTPVHPSLPTNWVEYASSGEWRVALSRGDGTFDYENYSNFPADIFIDDSTVRTFHLRDGLYLAASDGHDNWIGGYIGFDLWGVNLMDVNADGRKDFVFYAKNKGWYALLAGRNGVDDGFDVEHPVALPWGQSNPADFPWRSLVTDLDGNGREDMVFMGPDIVSERGVYMEDLWSSWDISASRKATIYASFSPTAAANTVVSVTDGLSSSTVIEYLPTSNPSIYTVGSDVTYPIQQARRPQIVVSDIYKDTGGDFAGGERQHFSYQYSGARTDLSGRGFLGFQAFVTLDNQTNLFKYQFVTQSFPMTGLVSREQTYRFWETGSGPTAQVNFRLISSHDNTIVFDEVVNGVDLSQAYGTVYPFMSKAVESRWENSPSAHFTLSKGAGTSSKAKDLFTEALPQGAHITISAQSWFDEQPLSTSPPVTLPHPYNASDRTTGWADAGTNVVTGIANYTDYEELNFPRQITYGNLSQLSTDFGDGFTETVVTTYHLPTSNDLTGLVDTITTMVSSTTHGTEAAPVKSFTYETIGGIYTPLVKTETIDATEDELDLETIYTRDTLGRVIKTEIDGFDSPGHARHIGKYTVSEATSFDDRFDLPTISKNAYGHTTTAEYHPFFGKPVSVTDVNGAGTLTEYDDLGRVTKVTDILKGTETITSYTWDSSVTVGPPTGISGLTLTSAYRAETTTTVQPTVAAYYDRLGRVIRTVKEGFAGQQTVTDAIYNTLGQVVATSLPYKSGTTPLWTKTTYDALGRVVTVTAPNATVITNDYKGRITQVTVDATDREPQTNATLVDAKGRTVAVWNADNAPALALIDDADAAYSAPVSTASIEFRLDGFGRMRETRLKGQTQLIFASYDAFGRQEFLNDPDKGFWEYVNNALGQVVTQTDAKSTVTNSTFDRLGRPLSRTTTEALNGPVETASWFYYDSVADASRHLVAKGDQGWIGALQREEAVTTGSSGYGASATASVRYYNSKGQPSIDLSLVDGKWFYTATGYDDFSRVSSVQRYWRPAGHESPSSQPYAWDNFGYSYSYDDESYVLNVVDSRGNTWWQADPASGYDHLDRPVRFRKDTGIWTDRTYRSTDGLLTGIATTAGAVSVQNLVFDYDGLGNLKSRQSGVLSENFEYDPLNRLTLSSISGSTEYFDNGNIRKKASVSGETTADYVYGSSKPHAVTSAFGYGMTYDANGNLESRTGNGHIWSTRWAGFDKPRWLAKDGKGDEFIYNANRSRVVHLEFDQMSDDQPSHYTKKKIYALGAAVEVDYTNTEAIGASWTMDTVRLYVAAPGGTAGAMEFKPGTTTWKGYVYHHDHLGSIDVITDLETNGGTPAADKASRPARYSYDAWGQRRDADTWTGIPVNTTHGGGDDITPRGFTGHEMMDGLGLVHMNGRIYDPLLGRFLSGDAVVEAPDNLQTYNRYTYTANNPLTFVDPSGYSKKLPDGTIVEKPFVVTEQSWKPFNYTGALLQSGQTITHEGQRYGILQRLENNTVYAVQLGAVNPVSTKVDISIDNVGFTPSAPEIDVASAATAASEAVTEAANEASGTDPQEAVEPE